MAGPSPAMTMGQGRGLVLGAKRRGNLHRSAHRDGDCFAPLAMTAVDPHLCPGVARKAMIDAIEGEFCSVLVLPVIATLPVVRPGREDLFQE